MRIASFMYAFLMSDGDASGDTSSKS